MALNDLINALEGAILEPFRSKISLAHQYPEEGTKLIDVRGKGRLMKVGQDYLVGH